MNSFNQIDYYCLKWVADDYEEVSEIKKCLARNDNVHLSSEEIAHSLFNLVERKLVQAYRYEITKQQYVETTFSEGEVAGLWFYITKDGVNFFIQNRDKFTSR